MCGTIVVAVLLAPPWNKGTLLRLFQIQTVKLVELRSMNVRTNETFEDGNAYTRMNLYI